MTNIQNKISVVVTYYNINIDQTKLCLKSLINQDLNVLNEIIVIDDGSNQQHASALSSLIDDLNNTHTHTHTHTHGLT